MKKSINIFGFNVYIEVFKPNKVKFKKSISNFEKPHKLNFGPGPNWQKPDNKWLSVDIDPDIGDLIVNFQQFESLALDSESTEYIYGSHVFEHISIFKSPLVFKEIFRVLKPGGVFRLILPDAEESIKHYVNKNEKFLLFDRRKKRAEKRFDQDYTLFECMREDFLSPNGQINLLNRNTLAHQNAWDDETIQQDLIRAGFAKENIERSGFKQSKHSAFDFEGTYPSEANQDYRSLYVEAVK